MNSLNLVTTSYLNNLSKASELLAMRELSLTRYDYVFRYLVSNGLDMNTCSNLLRRFLNKQWKLMMIIDSTGSMETKCKKIFELTGVNLGMESNLGVKM